ncbi:MAG: ANR family transcriptional regulator [Vibrio sp.]|uniref:ANR family transcriptional regulator n=1 Tax=Vibrio sp. TaxID=678 RepID=UPI003A84B2F4
MSGLSYTDSAEKACEKEKLKEWYEARELWLQANTKVSVGHPNRNWSWTRAMYCNIQLPHNNQIKIKNKI